MKLKRRAFTFTALLTFINFLKFDFVFLPVTSENLLISSALTFSLTEYFFYHKIKPNELQVSDFETLGTEMNIIQGIFTQAMSNNPFLISDVDETVIFGIFKQSNVQIFIETLGDLNRQLNELSDIESIETLLEDKAIYKQYSDRLLYMVFEMLEFHSFFSTLQTTLVEEIVSSIENDSQVIEFWKDLFSNLLSKLKNVISKEELEFKFLGLLHDKLKNNLEHYFIFSPSRTNINGKRLKELLHKILKFLVTRNKYTQKLITKLTTKLKSEAKFISHLLKESSEDFASFLPTKLKLHEVLRSLTPLFLKLFRRLRGIIGHNNQNSINVLENLIFIQELGQKTNNFYHVHRDAIDFVLLKNIDKTIRFENTGILCTVKRKAISLLKKIFKFFPEQLFEIIIGIFISDNLGTALKKLIERMRRYFDNM